MKLTLEQVSPLLQEALARGFRARIAVRGRSMRPLLRDGDEIELVARRGLPEPGQILLVRRDEGTWVLHRVTRSDGCGFFLRGDAQLIEEGPFAEEQVVAVAVAAVRGGRAFSLERGARSMAGRFWSAAPAVRSALRAVLRVGRPRFAGSVAGRRAGSSLREE